MDIFAIELSLRQAQMVALSWGMDPLLATLLGWKTALVGAWFLALFAAERLAPAAVRPPGAGLPRLARNGAMWLANSALSLLLLIPLTRWAVESAPLLGTWRPDWWAGLTGLLLDVLVLDFLIYWWHRANHRAPLLWRFHDVHHRDQFLDTTSAVRFHPGEVALSALARAAIIVPLAPPLSSILAFEALVLVAALFHHSNLRLPGWLERPLSWLIITPSIHWVHHHAVRADTDSNYGTVLSVWDRLFGSRSATRRTPDMPIGVQGESESDLLGLAALPFRPR
jgi:sterol desaturase/sphingolipid hydroxylase (fatty acid hydroxylase superfamily)